MYVVIGLLVIGAFVWAGFRGAGSVDATGGDGDDPAPTTSAPANLRAIAARHFTKPVYTGDATAGLIVIADGSAELANLGGFLDELGFSEATRLRMGQTRALDGTLTEESSRAKISWTFHPDHGLQIVVELTDVSS